MFAMLGHRWLNMHLNPHKVAIPKGAHTKAPRDQRNLPMLHVHTARHSPLHPIVSLVAQTFMIAALLTANWTAVAEDAWPQFRGINASGRAVGDEPLPADIGPESNVIWSVALPPGHSSPVVYGDRIYLTAVEDERLWTLAIEQSTGKVLWKQEAPHDELEEIHTIGSFAQPTSVTDGRLVVSMFGSSGLYAYDRTGTKLWHIPMGPFSNNFGAGSSPIMVDDWVILNQDHDTDSFLTALDKSSGEPIWRTDRSEFPRSYATPVLWNNNGTRQIVVAGTLRIVGYDLMTGQEAWTVTGISRIVNMTPTVGPDGTLFVAAWAPGGDSTNRIDVSPFSTVVERDANNNGVLEEDETPPGPIKMRFNQIDRDKDGHITEQEYESMRGVFDAAHNVMVAIRPGGKGNITETHVSWRHERGLPYVPSPVVYGGTVFFVKNGGIVSSLDAETGELLKTARVSGTANYYASPVAGDGKVYLLSQRGELSVISAEGEWKELASTEFGEEAFATPALLDGKIYLRTAGHLYCFGLSGGQ